MRQHRRAVGITAAILALAQSMPCRAQPLDVPDLGHAIDAIFDKWNSADSPGCGVGVQRNGANTLARAYGSADLEHGVPISPATVFEAGSVSKQFTAASILLLAGEHKLDLADDVRKYIPEMPDYGAPITIDELLSHTSGLRDWGEIESLAGWPRTSRVYAPSDVLDIAARQKSLNHRPGSAFSYTNTGYNLLALIVQRVSARTLARFTRERFFGPLGMSHTQWRDDFRRVVKDRAIAYGDGSQGYRQMMPFEDTYGHGGLLTTIGDLLRWNQALTAGELGGYVTTELQRQASLDNGRSIAYARGLFIESYRGVLEVAHAGATAGYRAWLGRYPQQHLSIAVLCNTAEIDAGALAHRVADLLLPAQVRAAPPKPALSARGAARREGLYVDEQTGLPLRLEALDGALRIAGGPMLVAVSASEFRSGTTLYRFDGNKSLTRETADGEVLKYRRTDSWRPSAGELTPWAGSYRSDEALATYLVTVKNGRVTIAPEDRRGAELMLQPLFADTFEFSGDSAAGVLHLTRDAAGKPAGFEMSNSRVHALAFRRIPERSEPD